MKPLFILIFLQSVFLHSQITGEVTDINSKTLENVSVFIKNTYTGTITNGDGNYRLNPQKNGKHTLVFRSLGYKTHEEQINYEGESIIIDVSMKSQPVELSEVSINAQENPAHRVIREAIKKRKTHLKKYSHYKANFYSRGNIKLNNVPEKILGIEVGDFNGALDSTRSGIVYLSETQSKIFQKGDLYREEIVSSKVSGDSNGYSFNTAASIAIDFYEKTIEFGNDMVSPIAENAFNYYNYSLEGSFYDENNHLINKIKITPKRSKDVAFKGFIYIVEDYWALYQTQVTATGNQLDFVGMDEMTIYQQYSYSKTYDSWIKTTQYADFEFGLFGFKGNGRFTAVYSDYDLKNLPKKQDFSAEVIAFIDDANKKDSVYWNRVRPVPLTVQEYTNYIKKDSVEIIRKSKPYLDSIDKKNNRFKWLSPITGYTYSNSLKNWRIDYGGVLNSIQYNTVQGNHGKIGIGYTKTDKDTGKYIKIGTDWSYGLSEKKGRISAKAEIRFNQTSRPILQLSTGREVSQFDNSEAISPLLNSISSLFFKNNFAKFYEKEFYKVSFQKEWWNGFYGSVSAAYQNRSTLVNHSDLTYINYKNKTYTSNHPLLPEISGDKAFKNHHGILMSIGTRFVFDQKYMSYPNRKFNYSEDKFPTLSLRLTSMVGASESDYNFLHASVSIDQSLYLQNKGKLNYQIKGGMFNSGAKNAFMDYYHPKSNETFMRSTGLDRFQLLPYYSRSTNDKYAEVHLTHDFKKWILGKIPVVRFLDSSLEVGFHLNAIYKQAPYYEASVGLKNLGFGKFRFLRIDYVRSYQTGASRDGVVFGISF